MLESLDSKEKVVKMRERKGLFVFFAGKIWCLFEFFCCSVLVVASPR